MSTIDNRTAADLRGWLAAASFAGAVFFAAALAAGEPAAAPEAETVAVAKEAELAEEIAGIGRNMWWNQPRTIEKLGLSERQQAEMNRIFGEHMAARKRLREIERPAEDPFLAALRAADLEAARKVADERGARAAAITTFQARLKLDVLAVLRPEQLGRLAEELPNILSSPWLMEVGGGERRAQLRRRAQERRRALGAGEEAVEPPAVEPPAVEPAAESTAPEARPPEPPPPPKAEGGGSRSTG